ncbi:flagellar transcriptional regulator FlhD [Betaproteobacteria bacterium GR16-43]|nr:flagellar transcriptional regulator FlhD [Betaproteobacteria bacterium GR16-43]
MNPEKLLEDIRETNLAYLMLAQHLIHKDKPEALYRLGVSEEVAQILAALTPAQLLKLAASNLLMCSFRFNDETVWNLLTSHTKERNVGSGIHASILMAGQLAEAA